MEKPYHALLVTILVLHALENSNVWIVIILMTPMMMDNVKHVRLIWFLGIMKKKS